MVRTTLASIGDGVIATDVEGNVTFLNPVAQILTGWHEQEAQGKPLESMFKIVNEQSRRPAENPVAKVLRDGVIAGLANHTVLISKSGTECPDRRYSRRYHQGRDQGRIIGVMLVFHSVSRSPASGRRAEEERAAIPSDRGCRRRHYFQRRHDDRNRISQPRALRSCRPFARRSPVDRRLVEGPNPSRGSSPSRRRAAGPAAVGAERFVVTYRVRHKLGHWLHIMERSVFERNAAGKVVRMIGCIVESPSKSKPKRRCGKGTGARTNFWPRWPTNYEIRWPRCAMRVGGSCGSIQTIEKCSHISMKSWNANWTTWSGWSTISWMSAESPAARLNCQGTGRLRKVIESALETSRPLIEAGEHELSVFSAASRSSPAI